MKFFQKLNNSFRYKKICLGKVARLLKEINWLSLIENIQCNSRKNGENSSRNEK